MGVWTGVCVDPLQCSPMCLVYECMCLMGTVCVVAAAELFNNREQHDAHEFLNYLVNTVDDLLRKPRPKGGASLWVEEVLSPVTCRSHHCPSPPLRTQMLQKPMQVRTRGHGWMTCSRGH